MQQVSVSVVVPMYRGENTIVESLRSVLDQQIDGCEILALDDGSPDHCAQVVESMMTSPGGDRLVLHRHANRGLAGTLNRGIALARGKYIARQDQDDLVLPRRLAKQKAFLDAHPDVAMVGTWAQIYVGDTPSDRFHRHASESDALRLFLLFDNPFVHASMMIRGDVLREVGGYSEDPERQPPEDYELWSRIARDHNVANIPEVLTIYREMPGSMSRTGKNPFLEKVLKISAENIHAVVGEHFSLEACYRLSCVYHGADAPRPHLHKREAMRMLELAVDEIGSSGLAPSGEFLAEADRLKRHIESRYLTRRLPAPVLSVGRWVRDRLLRRMKS